MTPESKYRILLIINYGFQIILLVFSIIIIVVMTNSFTDCYKSINDSMIIWIPSQILNAIVFIFGKPEVMFYSVIYYRQGMYNYFKKRILICLMAHLPCITVMTKAVFNISSSCILEDFFRWYVVCSCLTFYYVFAYLSILILALFMKIKPPEKLIAILEEPNIQIV